MTNLPKELTVRVARKHTEALDICSLDLVAADGSALPAFDAGAHIDVHLPGGLVRQYSLCNPPGETQRYQIAVLRDAASRGGSRAVHDAVQEGDVLRISAPRNHFALAPVAGHHLLLAGGIGVTPLLAMAEQLSRQGASFTLHCAARSRERMAFIGRMAASPFAGRVQLHVDDGPADQKLDIAATLRAATPDTHLYVCGPQGFMDAVLSTARAQGWPESRLHFEFFAGAPAPASGGDTAFDIEVARTGRVVHVRADQTALAALQAAGFDIPVSCEQGVCGTCLITVRSGHIDHRDQFLTQAEKDANDQFLPCCSRSLDPRLVIVL